MGAVEAAWLEAPGWADRGTLRELEAAADELGHKVSFATWSRWARELEWDQVPFVVVVEGPADRDLAVGRQHRL